MNVNVMMQYVTYGLALIGVLAFLVSIIVQVIKELPGLNKIPTSIVALVTSLILCPVALAVLCTYYKTAVTWYYIFASIIAAFVVYLVATGGWEKVKVSGTGRNTKIQRASDPFVKFVEHQRTI